ncbi:MAG: hypothetical protein Q4A52_02135 [Bacillota bacterium]|nr:hypothetical protein [Bacillota bacterium]
MDYLKFDCRELANQNLEFARIARQLERIAEDYRALSLSVDVLDSSGIRSRMNAIRSDFAELERDLASCCLLGSIAEIYARAEGMVGESVDRLPTSLALPSESVSSPEWRRRDRSDAAPRTSYVIGQNLVM